MCLSEEVITISPIIVALLITFLVWSITSILFERNRKARLRALLTLAEEAAKNVRKSDYDISTKFQDLFSQLDVSLQRKAQNVLSLVQIAEIVFYTKHRLKVHYSPEFDTTLTIYDPPVFLGKTNIL